MIEAMLGLFGLSVLLALAEILYGYRDPTFALHARSAPSAERVLPLPSELDARLEALPARTDLGRGWLIAKGRHLAIRERRWNLMQQSEARFVVDLVAIEGSLHLRARRVLEPLFAIPALVAVSVLGLLAGSAGGVVIAIVLVALFVFSSRLLVKTQIELIEEAFDRLEGAIAPRTREASTEPAASEGSAEEARRQP